MSRQTIAVSVKASKLTARALAYVIAAVGRKIAKEHRKAQTPHGKQSVRKLMGHGGDTHAIEVDTPKLFDKVARKWGVDYAIRRVGEEKYLLLFKARQADAITGCFAEYSRLGRLTGAFSKIRCTVSKSLRLIIGSCTFSVMCHWLRST